MTPEALLQTAALMGLFVLAGGAYSLFYSIGRLGGRLYLSMLGRACCAAALACAIVIATLTPLAPGWKLLIMASAVVTMIIPPVTWRLIERQHAQEEPSQ